jgi:adenylate cyclase
MAFFGEPVAHPDHAQRAVRTAIEMLQTLSDLNAHWAQEGRLSERFEIGIGINSGEAFVGLLGSEQRVSYTIIGDNVNLAARIQDLTKVYSWPIIISENTYQLIQDEFEVEFIERTLVRGKTESVNIYKILGPKGASASENIQTLHKE